MCVVTVNLMHTHALKYVAESFWKTCPIQSSASTVFQAIGFDTNNHYEIGESLGIFIFFLMVDVQLFPKLQYVSGFHTTKIMKKD